MICDFCKEPIFFEEWYWAPQEGDTADGMHMRPCWRRSISLPRDFKKETVHAIQQGWKAVDNAA